MPEKYIGRVRVTSTNGQLILTKSKIAYLGNLCGIFALMLCVILWFIYDQNLQGWPWGKIKILRLFIPLIILIVVMSYDVFAKVRVVLRGETFTFDRATNRFMRNAEAISPLTNIDRVRLRMHYPGPGMEYEYSVERFNQLTRCSLHLVLRDNTEIAIVERSRKKDEMHDLAMEIADYVDVSLSYV